MFQQQVPNKQRDSDLEGAIEAFRIQAQAIIFGSFAMLAFQIYSQYVAVTLQRTGSSRYAHLSSITLIMLTILWSAPVAFPSELMWSQTLEYHYRKSKRNLAMASALLVLAISAEIYVVTRIEMHSYLISIVSASTILVVTYVLWFLLLLYFKRRGSRSSR